ncbi:class I SAM-dependent methyltransferase [Haematobacter genomosp. 1]|uniref:MFS transporter n=1 Tax=Haematobacter genomosp. 1 TaxID=366618 RepID=A0A212A7J0_9RHOB|nr:class I SAM-dependent methyltransferase [Haematobacter genomosp. 1]OWJ75432.1 MFS transporter [Haematobacter genomosp. 1]
MTDIRLSLAIEAGVFAVPETGTILMLRPHAGADLSALPKERVRIVQGFRPDYDAFAAAGYAVTPEPEGQHGAAVVVLPRSRVEGRALIAAAVASLPAGAPVAIDGARTDGVEGILRELRARVAVGEVISKAHGKIFAFAAPEVSVFADWQARPTVLADGSVTLPGMFSADGPDPGSALLAASLPEKLVGVGADLGAGWGYLAKAVLTRPGVSQLDLIEAEHAALDCARRNVSDPRAAFVWADATRYQPAHRYDFILSNPPFHTGRAADPALGAAFIRAAARMLTPSGAFWMVANRHLPYEATLRDAFREVEEVAGTGAFKIFRASRAAVATRPAPGRSGAAVQRRRPAR